MTKIQARYLAYSLSTLDQKIPTKLSLTTTAAVAAASSCHFARLGLSSSGSKRAASTAPERLDLPTGTLNFVPYGQYWYEMWDAQNSQEFLLKVKSLGSLEFRSICQILAGPRSAFPRLLLLPGVIFSCAPKTQSLMAQLVRGQQLQGADRSSSRNQVQMRTLGTRRPREGRQTKER